MKPFVNARSVLGASREAAALGDAEKDILCRILAGASNAEIAAARATSMRTVANQVASIFKKLGVSSRRELIARARTRGAAHVGTNGTLNDRERLILDCAARGWPDKVIALETGLTTGAVGALLTRARRKVILASRRRASPSGRLAPARRS
jgi:DNA-binding NarL/FixJ family response regulator